MPSKILIVEDNTPIQQLYEFKLGLNGFDVRTASDGTEGLEAAKDFLPHLIPMTRGILAACHVRPTRPVSQA